MRRHLIVDGDIEQSEIIVGRGMLPTTVDLLAGRQNVAVLNQPTTIDVATRFATALRATGIDVVGSTLPDADRAKSLDVVGDVYRLLNDAHFTRSDAVLAIGGGAVTDVAGFIAATYLRGIDAFYVPTTVLGAVDAAIGGKTAVNVDGKNLAGVFRHPRSVIVDVDILDALPADLKADGAAEALKTGFIADMAIVEAYEGDPRSPDLEAIVNRSVAAKVAVVNEDFTEQGRRAILNYGHTVGHGIESAIGMTHGQAVSIGMIAEGAASHTMLGFGGVDRQRSVLGEIGLPVAVDATVRADRVRAFMALDKKRDQSGIRMVLLESFESPVVVSVDDATVEAAFAGIDLTP